MTRISRRDFVALAAVGAAAVPRARAQERAAGALTAHEVVDRIMRNVGVPSKPDTVDTFKAGDPAASVRGIAATALATHDVLRSAVGAGANLVITCEPTFYGRADRPEPPAGRGGPPPVGGSGPGAGTRPDPVYAAKTAFIRQHDLVIWRFSDHWRARRPDPLGSALAEALGWVPRQSADAPVRATIPAVRLDALATHVARRLNARGGVRVIGPAPMEVRTVGLLPGTTAIDAAVRLLPEVDAIIAGEVREWETVEYVRDVVAAGRNKGLILVGRVLSEDPGMQACARWLQTLLPGVAVSWMPAGDPYWRPV